jgi:hypothetical protein
MPCFSARIKTPLRPAGIHYPTPRLLRPPKAVYHFPVKLSIHFSTNDHILFKKSSFFTFYETHACGKLWKKRKIHKNFLLFSWFSLAFLSKKGYNKLMLLLSKKQQEG